MRFLLKSIAIAAAALYVTDYLIPGIKITGGIRTYLIAAAVLIILNVFARPLLKLLFLPINLLTLGMFRWVISVLLLWLTARFVAGFNINSFYFNGWNYQGFIVPAMQVSLFWTATLAAFVLNLITALLEWLIKG